MTNPVPLLRQAAGRLDELSALCGAPGPWRHEVWYDAAGRPLRFDEQWVHPGIAKPLAAWLRETAELIESEPIRPVLKRNAIDLARAILGGGDQ